MIGFLVLININKFAILGYQIGSFDAMGQIQMGSEIQFCSKNSLAKATFVIFWMFVYSIIVKVNYSGVLTTKPLKVLEKKTLFKLTKQFKLQLMVTCYVWPTLFVKSGF